MHVAVMSITTTNPYAPVYSMEGIVIDFSLQFALDQDFVRARKMSLLPRISLEKPRRILFRDTCDFSLP